MGVKAKPHFIIRFWYTQTFDLDLSHFVKHPHLPYYTWFWMINMSIIAVTPSTSGQWGGKCQNGVPYSSAVCCLHCTRQPSQRVGRDEHSEHGHKSVWNHWDRVLEVKLYGIDKISAQMDGIGPLLSQNYKKSPKFY